jgi:CubicO group peptidase (beta-lactamase class C family)
MRSRRARAFAVVRWVIALALVTLAVLVAVACLVLSPGAALRALVWGDVDVDDYLKFPSRPLNAPARAFRFGEGCDGSKVTELLEADPRVGDLQSFLESTQTQSFLVIQDDCLLYEGYFNGSVRDSIVTSFSVAKSFVSALVGIAIDEGWIGGVDDPITDYLPELLERDPLFAGISIRDLLLMSSGLRYADRIPYGDDVRTYYHPNLRSQALTMTEIVGPPGEFFLYNNYHPLLLGMILERSTGMPVATYLEQKLWQPLGMEFDGSWSLDSSTSGFEKMESGINGRAIDFAKFARLFLNHGDWQGTEIVPAAWVEESLGEDPARRRPDYYPDEFGQHLFHAAQGGYYKYMWYGLDREGLPDDFFATGNKGQFLYVSPSRNLIVVRNGKDYGPGLGTFDWVDLLYELASGLPVKSFEPQSGLPPARSMRVE